LTQKLIANIYQSANQSHLKIIDSVLNSSIILCIGDFKSSPTESIRNIAQETPPELRRTEKTYHEHLRKVLDIYQNYSMFFTDASKTEKGLALK